MKMIRFRIGRKGEETRTERIGDGQHLHLIIKKAATHYLSLYFAFLLLSLAANDSAIFQNGKNGKKPGTN